MYINKSSILGAFQLKIWFLRGKLLSNSGKSLDATKFQSQLFEKFLETTSL